MKKALLLPILMIATISCFATIRTVSNDPVRPAQFNTIQAAVNAAVAGDTIYVNASPNAYNENVTINKKLVLIGGGYNSPSQLGYSSKVGLFFFGTGASDASGTVICGFDIGSVVVNGSLPTVSNITIFRNRINGLSLVGNNWLIYNNIFVGSISLGNNPVPNNIIVQNNILLQGISGTTFNSNFLIDHNFFIGFSPPFLQNVQFATISNNIFAVSSNTNPAIGSTTVNNNFNNNLINITNVSATAPTNSFAGGPNTASGNFVGIDPVFVNAPNFTSYNASFNYRLQNTSPGKNAGTDGTDLGIYGGPFPFPSGGAPGSGFDTSAAPPIPQVTNVNTQSPSVAPGAQLKVTIQATVNN